MEIAIPIHPSPAPQWAKYFALPTTVDFPFSSTTARARIVDDHVVFTSTEDRFEEHLKEIDTRIAGTNRWYFEEYLASKQNQVAALEAQAQERTERVAQFGERFRGR